MKNPHRTRCGGRALGHEQLADGPKVGVETMEARVLLSGTRHHPHLQPIIEYLPVTHLKHVTTLQPVTVNKAVHRTRLVSEPVVANKHVPFVESVPVTRIKPVHRVLTTVEPVQVTRHRGVIDHVPVTRIKKV